MLWEVEEMYKNETDESPFVSGSTATTFSNTHVQDARSEHYELPYVESGGQINTLRRGDKPGETQTHTSTQSASARYNIRRWASHAKDTAITLQNAARDEDFMEATSAGVELTDTLSQLWRLRDGREEEFAEIVNMLQLALAKIDFESITVEQCGHLVEIVEKCLLSGLVDETEVRLTRTLLRDAGLNPWRGLSLRED